MTMAVSEADVHRTGFKAPKVNWAHTHSTSGQERDSKQDPLKSVNNVTSAYAVDVHTPDRTGF